MTSGQYFRLGYKNFFNVKKSEQNYALLNKSAKKYSEQVQYNNSELNTYRCYYISDLSYLYRGKAIKYAFNL